MLSALSFTSPLILGALALLPAIWWLLRATPPAPKEENFPAFIILRKLTNSDETPARTPWWLLLMRIALAALIIIALAGPILNAPPKTPGSGPILLVVDDTYSAAHHWRTRKDAMLTATAEAEQANRTVFLLTTAENDEGAPTPMTGTEARKAVEEIIPKPYVADRVTAVERTAALSDDQLFDIRWLADGAAGPGDQALADALAARGDLALFIDERSPKPVLRPAGGTDQQFRIERLSAAGEWEGQLVATAQDGRELARIGAFIADGETAAEIGVELPLALRNEVASVRIENSSSAGAVQLIDARDRRPLIGLVTETARPGDRLLSGAHFIREALDPHAELIEGSISEAFDAGVSVIVLDDIGAFRASEVEKIERWVEKGGVLIRFSGPILAETAQDNNPPLLPVMLRGGGRAFGGALTWETPQSIDDFPDESPFAGLVAPADVKVRRQVLAEPGGETTLRTWARLQDGTPLVTGERVGDGAIALFHITATPQWSDLPISGLFVDMLRRVVFLSTLGPESAEADPDREFQPLRLLDGFGRFRRPTDADPALSTEELLNAAGPKRSPGFYGSPDAPLALNVMRGDTIYAPLAVKGAPINPYTAAPPQQLAPPLLSAALALLLIDALAALMLAGKLPLPRVQSTTAAIVLAAIIIQPHNHSLAQPLDPEIDASTSDAALLTRLAYVKTGDPSLDRLSAQALAGLSRELYRRTALEPGPAAAVNLDTDDLSVYPFLYWPIAAGAEAPSDAALANIENFMRFGGLILFDTRDDERSLGSQSTAEGQALQRVLSQLNIPPLKPVDSEHVLARSFYLLPGGLDGRVNNNPVWVAADTSGANDGVTPIIIGGRDWAGAWAVDQFGRPVRPVPASNPRAREMAYRAGVNIVMVAFTGNYKSDQVHTPVLLERLGR